MSPEREAACLDAATPNDEEGEENGDTESSEEPEEKATGLENAIAHVLENCLKNENAPG